jgi:hypothetical protein
MQQGCSSHLQHASWLLGISNDASRTLWLQLELEAAEPSIQQHLRSFEYVVLLWPVAAKDEHREDNLMLM